MRNHIFWDVMLSDRVCNSQLPKYATVLWNTGHHSPIYIASYPDDIKPQNSILFTEKYWSELQPHSEVAPNTITWVLQPDERCSTARCCTNGNLCTQLEQIAVKCHNFVFKKVNRGFDQTQVWYTSAHALHLYHSHFLLPSQQINNTQYTQLILYTGAFFTFAHSINESSNANKLQTGCRITATLFQLQSIHNYTSWRWPYKLKYVRWRIKYL